MEELELVFEILESGPNSIQALSLLNRLLIHIDPELLNEHKPRTSFALRIIVGGFPLPLEIEIIGFPGRIFDGVEEMRTRNGVNSVAELIVQIPYLLENDFNLVYLHLPYHLGEENCEDWEGM